MIRLAAVAVTLVVYWQYCLAEVICRGVLRHVEEDGPINSQRDVQYMLNV